MEFKVRILGSSSALPTSERFPTSQVVLYNNTPYLLDCAEGTQMQMRKYHVPFGRLKNIFISHLHGDHIFGIFGLLSSLNLLGRKQDLNIYAPAKLKEIYESVLNLNNNKLNYKIHFHPLTGEEKTKIYENKNLQVFSFPLKHSRQVFGFSFEEKQKQPNVMKDAIEEFNLSLKQILSLKNGEDLLINGRSVKNSKLTIKPSKPRAYAFCTDTIPLDYLKDIINGVDLLYHEATFGSDMEDLAEQTMHTTAKQAAQLAKKVNAGKLVIGHFSSRYKTVNSLIKEANEFFPDTIEAKDGLLLDV